MNDDRYDGEIRTQAEVLSVEYCVSVITICVQDPVSGGW